MPGEAVLEVAVTRLELGLQADLHSNFLASSLALAVSEAWVFYPDALSLVSNSPIACRILSNGGALPKIIPCIAE